MVWQIRLLFFLVISYAILCDTDLIRTIILFIVAIVTFLFFKFYIPHKTVEGGKTYRRKEALRAAKTYIAPYDDIWKNLKLSNSYCYITLGKNEFSIEAFEKVDSGAYRSFKVLKSDVHDWEEIWNMFCKSFSYNKSYDGLLEDCRRFKLVVEEKIYEKFNDLDVLAVQNVIKKVDINNCSESDLAELPGVSIIMAKKTIKRRDEIGGFKNLEDFYALLKIQPNIRQQLEDIIFLGEKPKSKKTKMTDERRVDF